MKDLVTTPSITYRKYSMVIVFFLYICLSSCSISEKTLKTRYKKEVSQATSGNIVQITDMILQRYSYPIERTDVTANQIKYETSWRIGLPSTNELKLGYQEVRTKIIIEARPKMRTEYGQLRHFKVFFTGIAEYYMDGEWQEYIYSEETKQHFDEVSYELNTELARVLHTN